MTFSKEKLEIDRQNKYIQKSNSLNRYPSKCQSDFKDKTPH